MDRLVDEINIDEFNRKFDERFEQRMQELEPNKTPRLALIATKGTLDMSYPLFILASTGFSVGMGSICVFCIFMV